ncbi:hypothetical protein AHMF7605_15205 [Adhaeribacter arboris]|uniref:Uncharacterized protein n=1 Tax=Adhaeribacter arboris TaxID=2072846 RepID=A0A2T2YGW6_9BACT|nr:hypothetical protein [Adhaeribacter arboris]PSR54755.1 hypothetical protein AHMF7605_15205 [Adhaeribacter arboris]
MGQQIPPSVVLPDPVKLDFRAWLGTTYQFEWKNPGNLKWMESISDWFYALPYLLQSGVYRAYLRDSGIRAYTKFDVKSQTWEACVGINGERRADSDKDHDTAEVLAINEGLALRNLQLANSSTH